MQNLQMKEIKIKKKTVWIIFILAFAAVFVLFFGGEKGKGSLEVDHGQAYLSEGSFAPDFSITDVDGRGYRLSQFKGRKTVFAFFASWCAPCQIEAERLKKLDSENPGKFEVFQIGVDSRESLEDLKKFKSRFGNSDWIVGFGFDVAKMYNVRALDTTYIVDESGKIIYKDEGVPASIDKLREVLI